MTTQNYSASKQWRAPAPSAPTVTCPLIARNRHPSDPSGLGHWVCFRRGELVRVSTSTAECGQALCGPSLALPPPTPPLSLAFRQDLLLDLARRNRRASQHHPLQLFFLSEDVDADDGRGLASPIPSSPSLSSSADPSLIPSPAPAPAAPLQLAPASRGLRKLSLRCCYCCCQQRLALDNHNRNHNHSNSNSNSHRPRSHHYHQHRCSCHNKVRGFHCRSSFAILPACCCTPTTLRLAHGWHSTALLSTTSPSPRTSSDHRLRLRNRSTLQK